MEVVVPEEFQYLYVRSSERPVVKVPDPILRAVAREVEKVGKQTDKLIEEMIRVMQKANGIGLAAPQVGVSERVIVVATQGMKPMALINPRIVASSGEQIGQEGCLSIPGLYGDVKRAEVVEVEAWDAKGRTYVYEMEGMPARVVQHEIDHLEGVLFLDKVDLATLHWAHPDREPAEAE
jgi:peptide deformylase